MTHNAVDPAVRAAVEAELRHPHTPPRSRAALAREAGVSTRTVSRWADELGIEQPFTTRDVRAATEAATDRRRALRSTIADELLGKVRGWLVQLDEPHLVFSFGGKDNDYNEHLLPAPPTGDIKNLMLSIGIAVDKTIAIDKHDAQVADDDQAGAVLGKLFDGLAAAYRVLDQTPDDEGAL